MTRVNKNHLLVMFLAIIILLAQLPLPASALDEDSTGQAAPKLSILYVTSTQSVSFTYPTTVPTFPPGVPDAVINAFYSRYSIWPYIYGTDTSYAMKEDVYDYICKSLGRGIGYIDVLAVPEGSEASVKVYATTFGNTRAGFTKELTGEALYVDSNPQQVNGSGESYNYHQFQVVSGDGWDTCTCRVEVTDKGVTNNYNIICQGVAASDPLSDIKKGFDYTLENNADVSSFTSSAKTLVETAKPIYKARMEDATDAMEACKIANEFNIIVCQAKAIEDEYVKLNDKVTDAEDALSGISTAVKNSAIKAADAAEALDLTDYSEEDAEAITTAAEALKAVLEDDEATLEDILNAKEALEEAMYSAEDSALAEKKSENDGLRAKIAELTQAKEDAEAKLDDTEKKLDETKEKLAKAEKALIDDAAGKVVASAEKYIDAAKADLEKAAQAIAENAGAFAEDTAKKFFAKAAEAIKAATKGLEQVNGTLAEGNNRIEDLKSQLKELSETIKSGVATEAEVASLNKQLEEAKDELEQAKADLAKNEGISSELEQLKAELEKANAELAKATKPEQVTANSAKAGKKKVTVKWTALDGAEGYVVYRSLKKNKGFKAVKTIKKAKIVKFTDKKVKKGKKYFYKVRAYKMYDGNKLFGAYSKVLKTAKVK